jgi:hypothetical protein
VIGEIASLEAISVAGSPESPPMTSILRIEKRIDGLTWTG